MNTPFEKYFAQLAPITLVAASENGNDDVMFWVTPDEFSKNITLNVYDSTVHEYTHTFDSLKDADLDRYLDELETEFGMTFPTKYRTVPKEFIAIQERIISVMVNLAPYSSCDGCGDFSGSEVEAFYIPAISKEVEASLYMTHRFTCYDNPLSEGSFAELKEPVLDYLRTVTAEDGYDITPVKEFIVDVEKVKQ